MCHVRTHCHFQIHSRTGDLELASALGREARPVPGTGKFDCGEPYDELILPGSGIPEFQCPVDQDTTGQDKMTDNATLRCLDGHLYMGKVFQAPYSSSREDGRLYTRKVFQVPYSSSLEVNKNDCSGVAKAGLGRRGESVRGPVPAPAPVV